MTKIDARCVDGEGKAGICIRPRTAWLRRRGWRGESRLLCDVRCGPRCPLAFGAPLEPDVGRTHSGLIGAFGNYLVESSLSPCWASLCQRTRMKGEFWNYRVSSYRVIAKIQDGELLILVVRIGNRRAVYK
ncbi:Plasmid stabilisation system protein [Burkholderia sp. b14]|nr:Plasmid stabilisation system protein [Burkholderia sp. b14]